MSDVKKVLRDERKLDYLYDLTYLACQEFEVGERLDFATVLYRKAIEVLEVSIEKPRSYNFVSKRVKMVCLLAHNAYCYRKEDKSPIELSVLEDIYLDDEEKSIVNYVGFLGDIDKTLEYELMETLEEAILSKKKLSRDLYDSLYNLLAFEYNISIGAETPADEWIKSWNKFNGFKAENIETL
ncbi:hypothetical protein [uncultured Clostridium sp.]|uniref:hypothetical protein n=1 Tax=uncultured Clostridium sp. TaxID=59620 RepID=UPI0026132A2C|nr:hypothetical protein [uncultured Clostridium sp.]